MPLFLSDLFYVNILFCRFSPSLFRRSTVKHLFSLGFLSTLTSYHFRHCRHIVWEDLRPWSQSVCTVNTAITYCSLCVALEKFLFIHCLSFFIWETEIIIVALLRWQIWGLNEWMSAHSQNGAWHRKLFVIVFYNLNSVIPTYQNEDQKCPWTPDVATQVLGEVRWLKDKNMNTGLSFLKLLTTGKIVPFP